MSDHPPAAPIPTGWWATTLALLLHPRAFFAAAASDPRPWPARDYALKTAGLVALVQGVVITARLGKADEWILVFLLVFVLVPAAAMVIEALLGAWLLGAIAHLTLGWLGATSRPLASSARVFGYGQVSLVWFILPLLGLPSRVGRLVLLAFAISGFLTTTIGLVATHRCAPGKAAIASLVAWSPSWALALGASGLGWVPLSAG